MQPSPARRAPAARQKLQAAEAVLADLDAAVAGLALEASENKAGAEKALASHRSRMELAERQVAELQRAVVLATKIDLQAEVTAAASMRNNQLQIFERAGAERVQAMTEILQLVAKATTAFNRYVIANRKMVDAVPTGTRLPVMAFDDGNDGPWLGNGELLIGREAYRVAALADIPKLFFARSPPPSQGTAADAMRPAIEKLEEAQAIVLWELTAQVDKMNHAELEAAGVAMPPPASVSQPPVLRKREAAAATKSSAPLPASPPAPPAPPPVSLDAFAMTDAQALAGLTSENCCGACGEAGCALTGNPRCAHPRKGGLVEADKARPEVVSRFAEACKTIGAENIHEAAAA